MKIIIFICILILIYIIYRYFTSSTHKKKKKRKVVHESKMYDTLDNVDNALSNLLDSPTDLDYYNAAVLYDYNINDKSKAIENYKLALENITDDNKSFIYTKIKNRLTMLLDADLILEEEENNQFAEVIKNYSDSQIPKDKREQAALQKTKPIIEYKEIQEINNVLQMIDELEQLDIQTAIHMSLDERENVQKHKNVEKRKPEAAIKWVYDTQNVHDSKLVDNVKTQYEFIKNLNKEARYNNNGSHIPISPLEIYTCIKKLQQTDNRISDEQLTKFDIALNLIKHRNTNVISINDNEWNFISEIWNQSRLTPDRMVSFTDGIVNSYTNINSIVCSSGVIANTLSSLAFQIPGCENIGNLATTQSIKNDYVAQFGKKFYDKIDSDPILKQKYENDDVSCIPNLKLIESELDNEISKLQLDLNLKDNIMIEYKLAIIYPTNDS